MEFYDSRAMSDAFDRMNGVPYPAGGRLDLAFDWDVKNIPLNNPPPPTARAPGAGPDGRGPPPPSIRNQGGPSSMGQQSGQDYRQGGAVATFDATPDYRRPPPLVLPQVQRQEYGGAPSATSNYSSPPPSGHGGPGSGGYNAEYNRPHPASYGGAQQPRQQQSVAPTQTYNPPSASIPSDSPARLPYHSPAPGYNHSPPQVEKKLLSGSAPTDSFWTF